MPKREKPIQVNTIDSSTEIDGIKTKEIDQDWKLRLQKRRIDWIKFMRIPEQCDNISSSTSENILTSDEN